jgi:Glycosyltransferase family 25 (LPS biosynthesis protein)
MLNLFYSKDTNIESAYIITIKDNALSEKYSIRCQNSCKLIGMPYKVWDAYDGTGDQIKEPEHLKDSQIMSMMKVIDHYLTKAEVACILSHISLWAHCVSIDRPIVILEHDAIMIKKITQLDNYNAITYLGGAEWATHNWKIYPIPPHASRGPNHNFICRAHAYAIDPLVAKNLLGHVIQMGIYNSADSILRADLFNITHQGLHAYDNRFKNEDTTMPNRLEHHLRKFNGDLKL